MKRPSFFPSDAHKTGLEPFGRCSWHACPLEDAREMLRQVSDHLASNAVTFFSCPHVSSWQLEFICSRVRHALVHVCMYVRTRYLSDVEHPLVRWGNSGARTLPGETGFSPNQPPAPTAPQVDHGRAEVANLPSRLASSLVQPRPASSGCPCCGNKEKGGARGTLRSETIRNTSTVLFPSLLVCCNTVHHHLASASLSPLWPSLLPPASCLLPLASCLCASARRQTIDLQTDLQRAFNKLVLEVLSPLLDPLTVRDAARPFLRSAAWAGDTAVQASRLTIPPRKH